MRFLMNPHRGEKTSREKYFQLVLFWLFSNGDFFRRALFLEKLLLNTVWKVSKYGVFSGPNFLIFERSVTFLQSNYFEATINFSEQLFHQSSCFFWGAPFSEQSLICSNYFFQKATFSEQNFYFYFYFLRIRSSLGQLLLGTTTFLAEDLFRIKISTEW